MERHLRISFDALMFTSLLFSCLVIDVDGSSFKLKIYGITGDCPALKSICNFIGHNGYYCCYFCFVKGQHINRKRQYQYEPLNMRTEDHYSKASMEAERTQTNVFGHLGESVLLCILDTPFPQCIVLDYLHVTLLGHAKNIILSIYRQLRPVQRDQFNAQVKNQNFPRKSNILIHSLLCMFASECVAILLVYFQISSIESCAQLIASLS